MSKYSIVIPTYGRNDFLDGCFESIEKQTLIPKEVFIIDNNKNHEYRESVKDIVKKFSSDRIKFTYHKGLINSGAVARNHGASLVNTELVAFLDDDVILDVDYYEKIINVFKDDNLVVGAQGLDRSLVEHYEASIGSNFMGKIWQSIENFLENGTIFKDKNSSLRPSLAVINPIPNVDFYVESEWISTCAGVFKTSIFESIEFPKQFVKYSWNEYVFFSHSIFKKRLGKMIYTSGAKYRNIPTDNGRLPIKELVYMAEVYDLFIFNALFNRNFLDKAIYLKSRIGRFAIYTLRTLRSGKFDLTLLSNAVGAFYLAFKNRNEIKKGNFQSYDELFPSD